MGTIKQNQNQQLGKLGEELAIRYLRNNGFEVLEQNYRFDRAEIDIISKIDDTLIFVEVKTRKNTHFGHGEDAVGTGKQARIAKAAQHYIEVIEHKGEIRFDILNVLTRAKTITHVKDAFFPID